MLRSLTDMEEKNSTAAHGMITKVLQELNAAAGSNTTAIAFYEQAMRATLFAGQNREQTQFQEWKKKEASDLKDPEFQTAVRLHLTYLVLTLQRANGATTQQILPSLLSYISQVLADDDLTKQDLMKGSVTDGLFAKWYGIGKLFDKLKDWETNPGNWDGMYQKTILPQMRKDKDPRVLDYWDAKLQREAVRASSSRLALSIDRFNQVRKPSLLWSRAEDLPASGQRNRAITEMFTLVKNYPDHESNAAWIGKLKTILTAGSQPAPAPASASASASAPAPKTP